MLEHKISLKTSIDLCVFLYMAMVIYVCVWQETAISVIKTILVLTGNSKSIVTERDNNKDSIKLS